MDKRITEQPSAYTDLEKKEVDELASDILHESATVAEAVHRALPEIVRMIEAGEACIRKGGRIFYCGCGTGGRLCVLDTIEVQNTFTSPPSLIQAIFPGGTSDILNTQESKEDLLDDGWRQLQEKQVRKEDLVIGFSASGTTPFVLATLSQCRAHGIPTASVVNNPEAPISAVSDYAIVVNTGPEYVTGSTRMKAGTAQKMILDTLSTSLMIRLGRVEGNRMVHAKIINAKLLDRAVRTFMERHPEYKDYETVERLIRLSGSVKAAEERENR